MLGVAGLRQGVDEMSEELSDDMHLFMALWLCKREEEIKGMVLEELRRTYLGLADDDEECKELHSGAQFCASKASKLSTSKAVTQANLLYWYKSANTDARSSTHSALTLLADSKVATSQVQKHKY